MTSIRDWLRETSRTQTWLAEQLGMSKQYVGRVCKADVRPSPKVAYAIEDLSGGQVQAKDLLMQGSDPLALCRAAAA